MLIRELDGASEAALVERLILQAWGGDASIVVPRGLMVAMQLQGGLLAGAFEAEDLIGFVLGFPTRDPQVQHSHMMAVVPALAGRGVGLALKVFQRDWCLARGVERVEWTFDPLRGANANFNLRKLGAVIRRYLPNLYGEMSGINAGVASDRALAEWNLASERVTRALAGEPLTPGVADAPLVNPDAPNAFNAQLDAPCLRFSLPGDYGGLLQSDLQLARSWRQHGRDALSHYLERGYVVTGFAREGGNAYLLTKST